MSRINRSAGRKGEARYGRLSNALSTPGVNRMSDLHSLSERGRVEVESAYAVVAVRLKLLSK